MTTGWFNISLAALSPQLGEVSTRCVAPPAEPPDNQEYTNTLARYCPQLRADAKHCADVLQIRSEGRLCVYMPAHRPARPIQNNNKTIQNEKILLRQEDARDTSCPHIAHPGHSR